MTDNDDKPSLNFIQEIIENDNRTGKWGGRVQTRFPPEPNGYLHIGHAMAIHLSFGLARQYGGDFLLRFDDTNPIKEEQEYIDSITEDVKWLGYDLEGRVRYASDYFEQMYDWAVELIKAGKAYVCDLTPAQTREYRGTLTTPGKNSPYRDRPAEESLDLFDRMRKGEFPDGSRTLRAKIDMTHANLNMRDPVMYRILHAEHPRQGNKWCVYAMYDWAHGLEDSIENVTHSLCTLEFENHRPLYNWFIDAINEGRGPGGAFGEKIPHPQQIEFARKDLTHTVMSKRKLLELVQGGHIHGWDDPRMPTISGLRHRGYTPEAVRDFCIDTGVAKYVSVIDIGRLENAIRTDLNKRAQRRMGVLNPVKLVIDNYPEGDGEELDAVNNPEDLAAGKRKVPFSRELYIERDDFREDPPRKFFRLAPGREVRLRYAYFVTCTDVVKDADGTVTEVHCTYDPATRGGDAPDGRKVKGTIHWVSAAHALKAEVRLYDHLFTGPHPSEVEDGGDWKDNLNPDSLKVIPAAHLEPSLAGAAPGSRYQFERQGYFCVAPDATPGKLVFNRTASLRDSWAKIQKKKR